MILKYRLLRKIIAEDEVIPTSVIKLPVKSLLLNWEKQYEVFKLLEL